MTALTFGSPIGMISVFAERGEIVRIAFGEFPRERGTDADEAAALEAEKQITEYLRGERREFELRLKEQGGGFAKELYRALRRVPYGQTISYSELAAEINKASAARAAGNACRDNPLPIIVPCHRVIKKSGEMGRYNGGEDIKKKLLDMEGHSE